MNIALGKLACVPNLFIIITCCVALVRHFVHHMYSCKDSWIMIFPLLILDQQKKALQKLHMLLDLQSEFGVIQHSQLTKDQLATLPTHHGKMWVFRRCLIDGVLFHSKSYKRVIARNDYTVEFRHLDNMHYGSIHTYAKVEEKCRKALCDDKKCSCHLPCHYFAIVEILEEADEQLPRYRERTVVNHITKVKTSNRYINNYC